MTRNVGVVVTTSAIHSSVTPSVPGAGTAFFAGICERGPLNAAIQLDSPLDYDALCGGRTATDTLYDAVRVFFREGGKRAYIARVAGTVPVKSTLSLKDGSAGAGLNTLRVDAANAGVWGNDLKVEVKVGTLANTFRLIITYDGVVVADRTNLATPAAAAAAFATNRWVTVTDLVSVTASPTNNPRVLAATALASGDDDLDTVTTATPYITALTLFDEELGAGAVIIPGQDAADIASGVRTHCEAMNRIGLMSPPIATSYNDAIVAGAALLGVGGEWAGLFWPWVGYRDGTITRWVDPAAFAAGCRARAHNDGAWQAAAAAAYGKATFVTETEVRLTRANVNALAASGVNGIARRLSQVALRAWYPQSEENVDYPTLSVRDLLNVISVDLNKALDDDIAWRAVDGHGWVATMAIGICAGYLEAIKAGNGLFERYDGTKMVDPGYRVDRADTIESLEAGELRLRVSIRPAPHAALVSVDLVKVGVGSPL